MDFKLMSTALTFEGSLMVPELEGQVRRQEKGTV